MPKISPAEALKRQAEAERKAAAALPSASLLRQAELEKSGTPEAHAETGIPLPEVITPAYMLPTERAARIGRSPLLESLPNPPVDLTAYPRNVFSGALREPPSPLTEEERERMGSIGPREAGVMERLGRVFTEGFPAPLGPKSIYDPDFRTQLLTPEAALTPVERARHPIATGIAEFAGGLTTPENVAIIAGTGGLGGLPGVAGRLLPRLVSGVFTGQMLYGAYQQIPEFKAAIDRGDKAEAQRLLTHIVLSGAMATMAGQHAATGKPMPLTRRTSPPPAESRTAEPAPRTEAPATSEVPLTPGLARTAEPRPIGELVDGTRVEFDGRSGVVRKGSGDRIGFQEQGKDLVQYVEPDAAVRVFEPSRGTAPAEIVKELPREIETASKGEPVGPRAVPAAAEREPFAPVKQTREIIDKPLDWQTEYRKAADRVGGSEAARAEWFKLIDAANQSGLARIGMKSEAPDLQLRATQILAGIRDAQDVPAAVKAFEQLRNEALSARDAGSDFARAGVAKPVKKQLAASTSGGTKLYANPIFSRETWAKADRFFSENVTKPLAGKLRQAFEKLPAGVQRVFQSDFARFPAVRRIFEDARLEMAAIRNEGEALVKMWERTKPTREETIAREFVLQGAPQKLADGILKPGQVAVLDRTREAAMRLTAERKALGLNVREEMLEAPKAWYPRFYQQHLGQLIGGKLFGPGKMKPGKAAMGSLRQRLSDRYWIADSTGKPVEMSEGYAAAFRTREAAEALLAEKGGRGRIVEPMTLEQLVANGLILDPALNLRTGFGQQAALIGKTRFLAKLGEMPDVVSTAPRDGYIALDSVGFSIPKTLADKNPNIAKLRDGYVLEPLAKELGTLYGRRGVFASAYRVAEGSLRKWATVRNIFRHPRQIFENELLLALTDSVAFADKVSQAKAFRDYARGAAGDPNVPYWKEFINSRIGHTDLVSGEFQQVWRGLARQTLEPNAPLSFTERLAIWAETNPVARKLMAADDFAHRMYRAEDNSYKFYRYSRLRKQGMEHEAAVENVKDRSFDYFDVPPIVRAVNRVVPFAPNVAYQFARIFGNMLRDEPTTMMLRLGSLLGAYYLIREEMLERSGLTEKDIESMDKALQPKWYEVVLPWSDEMGRNLAVNLRWLIPYADVAMVMQPFEEEAPGEALAQMPRRLLPMVAQPIATAISQRTTFGREVLTGAEARRDALKKLAYASTVESLPVLLGGYWAGLHRNATAGERSKVSLAEKAIVAPVVGRVRHFYPEEGRSIGSAKRAARLREVQEELGRDRNRLVRGQLSGGEFLKRVKAHGRGLREAAEPRALAVAESALRGDRKGTQEGFERLVSSGAYASREAAEKSVEQLMAMLEKLQERETSTLAQARDIVDDMLGDVRARGVFRESLGVAFSKHLEQLPEADAEALLDWFEEQLKIAQRVHQKKRGSMPAIPPPRSGSELPLVPEML